ncbi:MAG: hypothetical protein V3V49_13735 [Candidatus Krumholzibacteria bacterium]
MSVLGLQKRDLKLFGVLLLIVNLPPIIVYSGTPFAFIFMFLPALFWVNVPGIPLALVLGEPHFDVQEFGAMPKDPLAWALIISFWIVAPYAATLIVKKIRKGTDGRDSVQGR